MVNINSVKIACLFLLTNILLCTIYGCATILPAKKQTISAVYKIEVKDPWLSQLTAITKEASIEASGVFKGGNYLINGTSLAVKDGTSFKINFILPIDNPEFINTENAKGELWTSEPMHSCGIPLPKNILIENGKVSGEVDFARVFGSFILNLLQEQLPSSSGNDMRAMVSSLHIRNAKLNLRTNSIFSKDNITFHIGRDSQVSLRDLMVDNKFNYSGICLIDLNFLSNNSWQGKKINCDFNGGNAHLTLNTKREEGILTFTPTNKGKNDIVLDKTLLQFGQNKRSSAFAQKCAMELKELRWQKNSPDKEAVLHLITDLKLTQTELKIKTDRHQTIAYFPETIPAKMQNDINSTEPKTQFATTASALAQRVTIEIFKPASNIVLKLEQAKIGFITFDKSGNLNLSFAKGNANLRELRWNNGKKYLSLKSEGPSQLSLPQGMYMLLDKVNGVKMSLPLTIKMGSAVVDSQAGQLLFSAIDGKIHIDVDNEIVLQGDISFVLEESTFLGSHQVSVSVRGLKLSPKNSMAIAHLEKCAVIIPNNELLEVIQKQFPKEKCVDMDKTLFEKQHWRYKDAEIKKVTLCDLFLEHLIADNVNSAKLIVSANVTVDGTVEKRSVLSMLKNSGSYKSKPWQIKANCVGFGDLGFRFVPNSALSKSELPYKLTVNLPIPDDVKLDWSKVEGGIYRGLEHGIIVSILKKMKSIPLTYEGVQPLFNKNHTQLDSIRLSNMTTKGTPAGVQANFMADATF